MLEWLVTNNSASGIQPWITGRAKVLQIEICAVLAILGQICSLLAMPAGVELGSGNSCGSGGPQGPRVCPHFGLSVSRLQSKDARSRAFKNFISIVRPGFGHIKIQFIRFSPVGLKDDDQLGWNFITWEGPRPKCCLSRFRANLFPLGHATGSLGVSAFRPPPFRRATPKTAEPLKILFQLLDPCSSKFNLQGLMFFHSLMYIVPKWKCSPSVLTVAVNLKL